MINNSVLNSLRKVVRQVEEVAYPTIQEQFVKYDSVIIEYITQQQLFQKSEDGNKRKLRPKYAPRTETYKRRRGQVSSRVTLRDTGEFYNSFKVYVDGDDIVIEATEDYVKYLTAKYGDAILEVQDENLEDFFKRYIESELKSRIDKIIETSRV